MLRTFVFEFKVAVKLFLKSFLWPNFDLNSFDHFASLSQKMVSTSSLKNSCKILSQQKLLCFLVTFSLLSKKFCSFLKYYPFFFDAVTFHIIRVTGKIRSCQGKVCTYLQNILQNICRKFNLLKINIMTGVFQGFWPPNAAPTFVEHLSMAYSNKWFHRIGTRKEYCFCVSMKIDISNRFLTYLLLIGREL